MQGLHRTDYTSRVIHGEYYPHIDGIRALAVIPVVLFHILGFLCPGGFAGVDVFFVISGYLITGGILRDLARDRFSVRNFYFRRIRRIMPAYFAMIIGVFAAGCTFYYAAPLAYLSESVAASTLFCANIHFWRLGGGYFAPQIHTQPLLHLWSLSVEEQFYLFIPLLCALVWKFRRGLVAPALALLAILSITGAIRAVMNGNPKDAFYLFHYRAWELLAGSLLAMLAVSKTGGASMALRPEGGSPAAIRPNLEVSAGMRKARAGFAIVGFLMVVGTYAVISSHTPFPGLAAVPPVIGTVLLIRYGHSGWICRLLSWKPFVAIGRISYSLYLWHWPVIVFWRYATYDQLCGYDYAGMFLLSLTLGYLSWKFVELPTRTCPSWTMRGAFSFASAGIVSLVSLSIACMYCRGWPAILHRQANVLAGTPTISLLGHRGGIRWKIMRRIESAMGSHFTFSHRDLELEQASILEFGGSSVLGGSGQPRILLVGDSHAGSLRYGLGSVMREKQIGGFSVSMNNTAMFDMKLPESQAVLRKLDELPTVTTVILAQKWLAYCNRNDGPDNQESVYDRLEEFARCVKSKGRTLLIVEDIPNHKYSLIDIAARMEIIAPRKMEPEWESLQQTGEEYDRMQNGINVRLDEICGKTGAVPIPLQLAFRKDGNYIYSDMDNDRIRRMLYSDADHLSQAGSLCAARFIMGYSAATSGLRE